MKSIWEQYRTRQHQMEMEDAVPSTVDTVIIDSSTLTPYFYACLYVNPKDSRQRLVLQDMHRYLLDDLFLNRYDLIFYLPIMPNTNTDDGTRFQSTDEIKVLADHMELIFTKMFNTNVYHIDTPFENRLKTVLKIIDSKQN